ncbi:hypothetical protein N9872_02010 [Paraglaciecola sp.]|nr:hypothetical protein [Paraglaciecola sp.]MDB4281730.1 hypothetical protein [Paraglaciecola sp.]
MIRIPAFVLVSVFSFQLGLSPAVLAGTPVTTAPWQELVVSVSDIDRTALFFKTLGGYRVLDSGQLSRSEISAWGLTSAASATYSLIGPKDAESGLIRLVDFDNAGKQVPMRPGARAWDTGCFFSVMVRVKEIESLYSEAIDLGWWTETPIASLQFGSSDLRIVIFKGPDGLQVQGYERLSPALPTEVGPFERMSKPFNVMQMVADHGAAYRFLTEGLGFDTFYTGPPVTAPYPTISPIGIPESLATKVGYQAGIVFPVAGEYGRMEVIQLHGLKGQDYRDQCRAPNLGILAVRFPVDDIKPVAERLQRFGAEVVTLRQVEWPQSELVDIVEARSPDGAIIQFYAKQTPK